MANDGVRVGTYVVVGAYVAKVGAGVGGMKTVGAKVLGEGLGEGDLLGERVGVEAEFVRVVGTREGGEDPPRTVG